MSKLSRFTRTLVLALCMTLVSAAALAAAPKLTLSVPSKEVRGGADYTITLTPTEPGFATVYLYQNGVRIGNNPRTSRCGYGRSDGHSRCPASVPYIYHKAVA